LTHNYIFKQDEIFVFHSMTLSVAQAV
jgi:hypothetical protein